MNGWVEKRLGEVCTLQRGFDLPTTQRKKGDYPLISSSGCIDSQAEAKVPGPGVVTGRSGSIGSVFFVDKDFWPLNTTLYVKDFHGNDPRFIFHLLRKFDLKRFASGAGVPTLNRNSVHSELVYIPTNVSEQKRIVAILDEAFEGIDRAIANTEKNLANSRELFESYLSAIFTQKSDGWVEKTIGEVCKLSQGLAINSKTKFLLVSKSSLPLLRITDLRNNTEEQFVAEQGYPPNCLVDTEDIIYTRTGNSLGLVFTGRKGVLHNNSFKIVPDTFFLDRKYLFWWLQNPSFKETIINLASRTAQPDITHKLFNVQSITLPILSVQKEFVEKIEHFSIETQRLETIYRQKLAALNELKQSILQKAFTGELTADTGNYTTKAAQEVNAA